MFIHVKIFNSIFKIKTIVYAATLKNIFFKISEVSNKILYPSSVKFKIYEVKGKKYTVTPSKTTYPNRYKEENAPQH